MASINEDARLLTPNEFANRANVSLPTVKLWRQAGFGPVPIFIGRRVIRYRSGDVDAWITSREGKRTDQGFRKPEAEK